MFTDHRFAYLGLDNVMLKCISMQNLIKIYYGIQEL